MFELKGPLAIVEIVLAVAASMVLGDYIGYKIGRWRLAAIVGSVSLLAIVAFVAYAIVVLR